MIYEEVEKGGGYGRTKIKEGNSDHKYKWESAIKEENAEVCKCKKKVKKLAKSTQQKLIKIHRETDEQTKCNILELKLELLELRSINMKLELLEHNSIMLFPSLFQVPKPRPLLHLHLLFPLLLHPMRCYSSPSALLLHTVPPSPKEPEQGVVHGPSPCVLLSQWMTWDPWPWRRCPRSVPCTADHWSNAELGWYQDGWRSG